MTIQHKFVRAFLAITLLFSVSLSGCGGGIDVGHGLRTVGLFYGSLSSGDTVLLVLHQDKYFLLSGNLASKGTYAVDEVSLTGSGDAYNMGGDGSNYGTVTLSGSYRTNKHILLTWHVNETGDEQTIVVEASDTYYEGSSQDAVQGGWINQQTSSQSSDIVFFNVTDDQIEGAVLSSLTQITGLISVTDPTTSVYGLSLTLASGGTTTNSDPYDGFGVVTQTIDSNGDPRPQMLVLTASPTYAYVNQLYWVSQEELQQAQNSTNQSTQ